MGIIDAQRVIEQVRGGQARRDFMRAFLHGAIALLNGDAPVAAEQFGAAFRIETGLTGSPMVTTMAGLAGIRLADFLPARDRFARLVAMRRAEGSLPDLVSGR